ncbi:MAG: hypothetical protein ACRDL8_17660 [Solirubrobacteraceae bacterium]
MSDDRAGGGSDVERYEQLRARAVSGEPDGFQMGLAMLERRGLAAWARVWQTTAPARPAPPARAGAEIDGDAGPIVAALATMALACAVAG